ncbi:MAG: helix-hairpin-helix domain-containing protein [Candidatus Helarchaeota archaeon]
MSEDKFIAELMKLKGLTKRDAQRLIEAGIKGLKKLGQSIPDELANATGIPVKKLTTWIILARARERKKFLETEAAVSELSQLLEIKIDDAKRLVAAGVMGINDLAEESPDLLAEDTGIEIILIKEWIKRAKAIKKLPPEERKIKKVVPTPTVSGFGKFSGALIGKKAAFKSIYSSGNIGGGFFLLLLGSAILSLYLTMTNSKILMDFYNLVPMLGSLSMTVNLLSSVQVQFYWGWFIVLITALVIGWVLLSGIVKGAKGSSFSNTAAVMGFGAVPGLFFIIVVLLKFIDNSMLFGIKAYLLPGLAAIIALWVLIVIIRGASAVPKE